jgi:hypothetical protein
MSESQATLGTSCATLHDGVAFFEHYEEEQYLLRQLQDHLPVIHIICL